MSNRIRSVSLFLPAFLLLSLAALTHGQPSAPFVEAVSGAVDPATTNDTDQSSGFLSGKTTAERPANNESAFGIDDGNIAPLRLPGGSVVSVRGIVYIDANNNGRFDPSRDRAVAGATVIGDSQASISGRDGSYSISDLGNGRTWLSVAWPSGQKTRMGFDLDPSSVSRVINIGTTDQARALPAPPVIEKVVVKAVVESSEAIRAARPQLNTYPPAPSYGDAYAPATAYRQLEREEDIEEEPALRSPAENTYQRRFVAPSLEIGLVSTRMANTRLRGHSTGNAEFDGYILDSSTRYGIDPLLIYAQMGQESSYKKRALSVKGASGLMQLMPATARRMGVANIYDPKQNIEGGVKYMRLLLNMFDGDLKLALAGYNAGEGAVIKYGYEIPPYNETQDYVRRISARYRSIAGPSYKITDAATPARTRRRSVEPSTYEAGI
jgi:soluble lytic murein transglycosylase-like protein